MRATVVALALIVAYACPSYAQQWDQVNGSMQVRSGPSAPLVIIDQTASGEKIISLRANGTEVCYATATAFTCTGGFTFPTSCSGSYTGPFTNGTTSTGACVNGAAITTTTATAVTLAAAASVGWSDLALARGAAGRLNVSGGSTPTVAVVGANAQRANIAQVTTSLTTDSGVGTATATNLIPAGSLVIGIDARVTTTISGAGLGSFSIGDGTDADRWGTGIALAAGTTVTLANATIATVPIYAAATSVVLTANAGQFDAGVIRITVHYISLTAAGS